MAAGWQRGKMRHADISVFANKLERFSAGCWVCVIDGEIVGYMFSHPGRLWSRLPSGPPFDTSLVQRLIHAWSHTEVIMDPLSIYQWLYEKTDGRFTWLGGLPVLLLRTIGAKTGKERTAALVYLQDGDDLVVVASAGGSDTSPGWFFNIQKNPDVGVQIGRQRTRMRAHIADPQERTRLWPRVNQNNSNRYDGYQAKTKRQIPVVVLSPL